ncbi:hypothetical protein A2U01_0057129, partial [Trifolium medium]|nr:hypothetical protein [Trifolium medium]
VHVFAAIVMLLFKRKKEENKEQMISGEKLLAKKSLLSVVCEFVIDGESVTGGAQFV